MCETLDMTMLRASSTTWDKDMGLSVVARLVEKSLRFSFSEIQSSAQTMRGYKR